jgi:hypothetical protein
MKIHRRSFIQTIVGVIFASAMQLRMAGQELKEIESFKPQVTQTTYIGSMGLIIQEFQRAGWKVTQTIVDKIQPR